MVIIVKKIVAMMMLLTMILGLAGCGSANGLPKGVYLYKTTTSHENGSTSAIVEYNPKGYITSQTQTYSKITYTYDEKDRVSTLLYTDGSFTYEMTITYEKKTLDKSILQSLFNAFVFDNVTLPETVEMGTPATINGIEAGTSGLATYVFYCYDESNRLIAERDMLRGACLMDYHNGKTVKTKVTAPGTVEQYDKTGQLVMKNVVTIADGKTDESKIEYTYEKGDLVYTTTTTKTSDMKEASVIENRYTYKNHILIKQEATMPGRVTTQEFTADAEGNYVNAEGTLRMKYDDQNRLVREQRLRDGEMYYEVLRAYYEDTRVQSLEESRFYEEGELKTMISVTNEFMQS